MTDIKNTAVIFEQDEDESDEWLCNYTRRHENNKYRDINTWCCEVQGPEVSHDDNMRKLHLKTPFMRKWKWRK